MKGKGKTTPASDELDEAEWFAMNSAQDEMESVITDSLESPRYAPHLFT